MRARIRPDEVGLPSYGPRRVQGLRREDVAELAGVSTRWYELFETGSTRKRFSFEFVGRVADALRLAPDERATLFRLALPHVAEAIEPSLQPSTADVLDSIGGLRNFVRRVWSASSVSEIFTTVTETIAENFKGAEQVGVFRRIQPGEWDYPVVLEDGKLRSRAADLHFRLREGLAPEQIDESMLHGLLTAPGEVGTWRDLLRNASVKRRVDSALQVEGLKNANCLNSYVTSDDGIEATIFVSYLTQAKEFSELDQALLGTLADVASFATRSTNASS